MRERIDDRNGMVDCPGFMFKCTIPSMKSTLLLEVLCNNLYHYSELCCQ